MLLLLLLPGRLITHFGYLYPGKGQLWASKRRDESGCLHVVFSAVFWVVAGVWTYDHFFPDRTHPSVVSDALVAPTAVEDSALVAPAEKPVAASTASAAAEAVEPAGKIEARPAAPEASSETASDTDHESAATPDIAAIARNPHSITAVEAAIQRSFQSGAAQRWHSHHLDGYAVAGPPGADGCRLVQVSIDSASDAAIEPIKVCAQ